MAQTNDEFNKDYNRDLRMPMFCKLSFISRISNDEWIELIKWTLEKENSARLAALDDCKTLLERVLSETQDDNHKGWAGPTYGLKRALAELEALRKKVN